MNLEIQTWKTFKFSDFDRRPKTNGWRVPFHNSTKIKYILKMSLQETPSIDIRVLMAMTIQVLILSLKIIFHLWKNLLLKNHWIFNLILKNLWLLKFRLEESSNFRTSIEDQRQMIEEFFKLWDDLLTQTRLKTNSYVYFYTYLNSFDP